MAEDDTAGRRLMMMFIGLTTVAGAVAGIWVLDADWSVLRRILAGAFAGAGCGLILTANRLIH